MEKIIMKMDNKNTKIQKYKNMLTNGDIQKLIEVFATREEMKELISNLVTKEEFSELQVSVDVYAKKADTFF